MLLSTLAFSSLQSLTRTSSCRQRPNGIGAVAGQHVSRALAVTELQQTFVLQLCKSATID